MAQAAHVPEYRVTGVAFVPRVRRVLIDLHSHLLPGLDDGPEDLAGSLAMAALAAQSGTQQIVATPHLREDYPKVRPDELAARVAQLRAELARAGIQLDVYSGAEVDLSAALESSEEALRAATLAANGRDLLLETPYGVLPSSFENLLASVRGRGYRLTLAHPELNPTFQADPKRLAGIARDGVLIQITARSFEHRSPARALALEAVEGGWATVLASDAHSAQWRPPVLGEYVSAAAQRYPGLAERIDWMTAAAPAAILKGQELPAAPPTQPAGRRERIRRAIGR